LLDKWWGLVFGYVGLLGVAMVAHRRALRLDRYNKYLDYRALAEALRVQFFWKMAGLKDSVADHYLRTFRSDLDWIRQAVRACNLVAGGHDEPPKDGERLLPRLRQVLERWVQDQANYFGKSRPRNESYHRKCETAAGALFIAAVALAILAVPAHLSMGHINHWLIVGVFLSLAVAGLLHEYAESAAFAVQARKYEWMHSLFTKAARHLPVTLDAGDCEKAQRLLHELGDEALAENADWVIQHRTRPPRPPRPG
jgi:hypothetical protein